MPKRTQGKSVPPKNFSKKEKISERKPLHLIDRREALARNELYAKDFHDWQKYSGSLEARLERGGILEQISDRMKEAGIMIMPDPKHIPGAIKRAHLQAEGLVSQMPKKPKKRTSPEKEKKERELKIRKIMEQELLIGIFQPEADAVRQIPYIESPSTHKGIQVDTYSYLRQRKFCMVEIDIAGGTKEELLEAVGVIIDNGRDVIQFQPPPKKGKTTRLQNGELLNTWEIYDKMQKEKKTAHAMAKELLRSKENAGYNDNVKRLSKVVRRTYNEAKEMISLVYRPTKKQKR